MGWGRCCRLGACLTLLWLMAACSGGATKATTGGTPASSPPRAGLAGLIALGHSGLTGENSNPSQPGVEAKQNSWATGTAAGLRSIYQRMTAIRPDTGGHVANAAVDGATAADLAGQARQALSSVPAPALAIIQTIDGDIRCDGSDAANVKDFGRSVAASLQVITTASPRTQILIISQPGRPSLELSGMAKAIATNPAVRAVYTGPGPCGLVDKAGRPIPAHVAALTAIISAYESEQARVCARFPTCQTDGGGLASFKRVPSMVSSDYNHLNLRGQALLAAAVWPYAQAAMAKVPGD
jgi:hypothetical protein